MSQTVKISIAATDIGLSVVVKAPGAAPEAFRFAAPGLLTGAELRQVLEACGLEVKYRYQGFHPSLLDKSDRL